MTLKYTKTILRFETKIVKTSYFSYFYTVTTVFLSTFYYPVPKLVYIYCSEMSNHSMIQFT